MIAFLLIYIRVDKSNCIFNPYFSNPNAKNDNNKYENSHYIKSLNGINNNNNNNNHQQPQHEDFSEDKNKNNKNNVNDDNFPARMHFPNWPIYTVRQQRYLLIGLFGLLIMPNINYDLLYY